MPLGREVDLASGNIMQDEDAALPPQKGHGSPALLGPCLLWPNGSMNQDVT